MYNTAATDLRDFIAIELRSGYPRVKANIGDYELELTVDGKDSSGTTVIQPMNDNEWHTVEVFKNGKVRSSDILWRLSESVF